MMTEATSPVLDTLATQLEQRVRHAAAARTGAALAAQFDGMRGDLESASSEIDECMTVLFDSRLLQLPSEGADFEQRKAWVAEQLRAIRKKLDENPASVRQGDLWRNTKRAIETLRNELLEAREQAYAAFLDEFAAGDRELLQSLPPGVSGAEDYRQAIEEFERVRERLPGKVDDVARAAAAGRRLEKCRHRVESEAVPAAFKDDWRALRGEGLPLTALNEELLAWLKEHELARSVVLQYRTP